MHVERIVMQGFMSHQDTTLHLPRRGVVLVTGENGAGKSAIVEGIAYGFWGETLRKSSPWSGATGLLDVSCFDGLRVVRTRAKSRDTLEFCPPGGGDLLSDGTPSKTQVKLASYTISWPVWRRAFAFSSSDAMHFSLATDGEQKRLIEGLLGLDIFDPALKLCRAELVSKETELGNYERKHAVASAALDGAKQRLADAQQWQAESTDRPADLQQLRARSAKLSNAIRNARQQIKELQSQRTAATLDQGVFQSRVDGLRHTLELLKGESCPTCNQPITPELRKRLAAQCADAEREATMQAAASERAGLDTAEQLAELAEDVEGLSMQLRDVTRQIDDADAAAKRAALVAKVVAEAQDQIAKCMHDLDVATDRITALRSDIAVLKAVESVLGLRGVRTAVLSRALDGLDSVASLWLARIAGDGIKLRLQSFTQTKTAGTSDKFSMTIEGAGGGHGYAGASQGQRRRIDVALLFALSEVAAASHGLSSGTMLVDEVFDSLDQKGVEAVASAMAEVAKERCVVLITHSHELQSALTSVLRPVARWHVTAGVVNVQ